jgi:tetratricopeptide (TPR) repeat protein
VFQKAAARLLMETNPQDEKAGALLAMATRAAPDDAETHFFFGQWLCVNQREEACITELNTAAGQTRGTNQEALAQIFALLGTAHMNSGNAEEAQNAWRRAMLANQKSDRPSPELNIRYSAFLRRLDHEHEADDVLRATLKTYPEFGPAHFEAAEVAFRRNDTDTAEREARKALEFRGYGKEARNNIHMFLASVYARNGRYADADRERAAILARSE